MVQLQSAWLTYNYQKALTKRATIESNQSSLDFHLQIKKISRHMILLRPLVCSVLTLYLSFWVNNRYYIRPLTWLRVLRVMVNNPGSQHLQSLYLEHLLQLFLCSVIRQVEAERISQKYQHEEPQMDYCEQNVNNIIQLGVDLWTSGWVDGKLERKSNRQCSIL